MPFFYYLQIHIWLLCSLGVLTSGWPGHGFVINNKQMAFLQIFVSQPILFLFSKDTMSNVTDCGIGRTDLWQKWDENDDLKIDSSSIWRLSVAQYLGMFLEATKRVEFLRPQDTPHLFFIPCLPH